MFSLASNLLKMDAYSNDFQKIFPAKFFLVVFIYVPVRRHKDVSNRSVLLKYQLRRRDDVLLWSRTFKLVTKMGQFLLGTRQYVRFYGI